MSEIPRMRTAEGALAVLKADDPGTAVSLKYIRRLINTGEIPCVNVGRKKLINVDDLAAYLSRKAVAS